MHKHKVNLRLFQSKLGDIAKLVGNNYFHTNVSANTHNHIGPEHPDNANYKYQCYIADVGSTGDHASMEEALKDMKKRVKTYLAKPQEEKVSDDLVF